MNQSALRATNSNRFRKAHKVARVLVGLGDKIAELDGNEVRDTPTFVWAVARRAGVNINRPLSEHTWRLALGIAKRQRGLL